ncbi:MAG: hypothetical protein A3I05_07185 [Deltaproteobacteria bacterium RIFCSPLOWO2_02_FULL_44_10]|nr:MAG: hypothetical protein A3C46_04165 [Deltaproteobacteria bacterium RIFCSPHIGHO2_02_FULL_44_16]OGQ46375.1 MAG: hypothetical protein A3I05_07185 [Deltaproteobacteria bacterium RIFCSPLOWO2_02_FULL_44_10]
MRILVAEDELKVRNFVVMGLQEAGMVTDAVASVAELLSSLRITRYDVLILDRLLKGVDSLTSLAELRRLCPSTKILILSALAECDERVKGLTEGADDYLGKPFHVHELIARIRALVRRQLSENQKMYPVMEYKDVKIDLEQQRAFRHEKRIELTGKELRLLSLLMRHPGKVFSKAEILDQCWDINHCPESNVVEVTIASLRSKLDRTDSPRIQSKRGIGYWLGEP